MFRSPHPHKEEVKTEGELVVHHHRPEAFVQYIILIVNNYKQLTADHNISRPSLITNFDLIFKCYTLLHKEYIHTIELMV